MPHVLRHTFTALFLVASTAAATDDAPPPEWGYKGADGPSHWGGLALDYPYLECRFGKLQSPIDIGLAKTAALPPIEFNYGPAPLRIINTGHSIQVNLPPGSFISVGGKRYELVQFHFHHPSETKLAGARLPLEMHLVHKDADGKLAVVAVLFATGKDNPLLDELFHYMPLEKGKEMSPDGVTVSVAGLLPDNRAYYTFPGSLTTPPCTEDVTWFVMRTPVWLSEHDVARFAQAYHFNARPTQPVNGRLVQMTE
jgi:carbonic anhydrase